MLLAPEPFKLAQQETKTRELRNASSHYANVKKGDKLLIVKTDERKQCDNQLQQNQMCRETSMLWGKILPTEKIVKNLFEKWLVTREIYQ